MSGKSRRTSKIAAAILIFTNIFNMMVCTFVFALSLWVIASPSSLINVVRGFGNPTMKSFITAESLSLQLGLAGALIAGFFFCISFMGLYGALSGSQFLLFMYATLLVLLLLLECSLTYYFTSNLEERGIQPQDIQLNHILRTALRCCDRNYTVAVELTPPWSCCSVATYPTNCTIEKIYTLILAWSIHDFILCNARYSSYHIVVMFYSTAIFVSSSHLTIAAPFWRNPKETLNRHSHFTKHRTY